MLRFARNILPESKRHESKHLKKTNSNSAPLLKLLHLKHELFLFVLQSTRKMIGFKQTSNNSRMTVDIYLFIYYILLGRILQLPRGKGHKRTSRSYSKVPHLTHPPIRIRKTATAPGPPYSFRIVRGFFYVPQNYQHSRNCETGPPTYRPYPRRLESLTICR